MKLTLRQEWRLRPLNSFLGCIDIKLGVTIAILFAVLNKVAGIYGLITVFTGGSFAQVSMYLYSVIMLLALAWALKAVAEEDPKRTLYFAHIFFADHVLSTAWTVFFAVEWWLYTPHDGRRQTNSAAQEQMLRGATGHNMTDEERSQAAMGIWNKEKSTAAAVIIAGWFAKIYFAILIYSYAVHLRRGSYRSLPHSNQSSSHYIALNSSRSGRFPDTILGEEEEEVLDDFYKVPTSANTFINGVVTGGVPVPPSTPLAHARTPGSSSVGSFADFVSAPGRGRRYRGPGGAPASASLSGASIKSAVPEEEIEDEVLFDSDEIGGNFSSKVGTEENTSVSSRDDDGRRTPSEGAAYSRSGQYSRERKS